MAAKLTYEELERRVVELELILNLNPGIICTAGIDGYFKKINPAMRKALGFSEEELLSRPLVDFIHPDDTKPIKTELGQIGDRRIRRFENRYLCKDGSYRLLEWHTTSAVDGILYAMGHDITKRRQVEKALQASEAELKAIIEYSATGITVSDLQGHVLQTNPAHQKMFGYSSEELRTLSFADFTHPEDVGKHQKFFGELLSGKIAHFNITKRFVHKDGHIIWAQVNASLVRDKNKEPLFVVGIVEDITERKLAEDEKEKLIIELQEALDEIKTLRGIIPICSHCKKIRDDEGLWKQMEAYICDHSEAQFSHGICPDCQKKYYSDFIE